MSNLNSFGWDDDLFDDDFLDDDQDDLYTDEVLEPEVKKKKPEKAKSGGGLFRKKKAAKPAEKSGYDDTPEPDDPDDTEPDNTEDYEAGEPDDTPERPAPVRQKKPPRSHVHGLKKKDGGKKGVGGKIAAAGLISAAVVAAGFIGTSAMNGQIRSLKQSNQNLTDQIASQSMNVYTAKRDIKKGDELITSGDQANVELSQIYTSLPETEYISGTTTGYAQVDISAGEPVMAYTIGDTNPVSELNDAIAAVKAEDGKAKEMPYKITADFVDLSTGNTLAESRDLLLDPGANEKAFNTEAETIDGYVLKSIQVDKEGVHAYGVSEKSMKEGIVTMYYFTTKGGWGRHEIKGNIRVTYGYVKKDDPSLSEEGSTDVMDDSAWIQTENTEQSQTEDAAESGTDTKKDAVQEEDKSVKAQGSEVAGTAGTQKQAQTAVKTKQTSQTAPAQNTAASQNTASDNTAQEPSEDAGQASSMSEPDEAGVSVETETIGIDDAE